MVKLIVFDLDGVLVDSRETHYESLNKALSELSPDYVIRREEHLSTYDGLSTKKKLAMLTERKGLPVEYHEQVWRRKQEITEEIIMTSYTYDERIRDILKFIKGKGIKVYVASNSIHRTVQMILLKKGFLEFVDYFVSNEDVANHKPSPEMYFKCMVRANVTCQETIIVEDSHIGRKAALGSGANLLPVENPYDLTLEKIEGSISHNTRPENSTPWQGECNVVIPMAGEGSRFVSAGYSFPKPLIEVNGKPMIQVVVENLNLDPKKCRFIFICREAHMEKYNLSYLLKAIAPGCEIITTDGLTKGAACSILLARELIDNDKHLVLANSDQFMEWDANTFMYSMIADDIDGGIATFENSHPKWSYAKLDEDGFVCEVAEKKPISTHATTGVYYWKRGSDFVRYADSMIEKNVRVNNEFYTAPVFNEAIKDERKIKIFPVSKMWGIGVPEDLDYFLNHYQKPDFK